MNLFKKPDWYCANCGHRNNGKYHYCDACEAPRITPNGHKPDGKDRRHDDRRKDQRERERAK